MAAASSSPPTADTLPPTRRPSRLRRMESRPDRLRSRLSGVPPKDSTTSLLLSGAAAGAVSKGVTAPIDRVKIMYQVRPDRSFTLRQGIVTAEKIVRSAGVVGLWRGNSAAMLRDMPYAAIVFATYAMYEETLCGALGRPPEAATRLAAGSAAGCTATCLTYPLDLLRARFAAERASAAPQATSYLQSVRQIVSAGGPSALFAGLRPTLLGIVPYSGISFGVFEGLKAEIRKARGLRGDEDIPVLQRLLAGGAAGLIAQSATYPLHVVRRRMQVDPGGSGKFKSTLAGLRWIYATEGIVNGLFKGLTLTILKGPLQAAIGFTVNDYCRQALRRRGV